MHKCSKILEVCNLEDSSTLTAHTLDAKTYFNNVLLQKVTRDTLIPGLAGL